MSFRKQSNFFLMLVLVSCFGVMSSAWAEAVSVLNVVSVSGKQRMLSQRVLKAYAQVALHVVPDKSSLLLASSLAELKDNNMALQGQAKTGVNLAALQTQTSLINKLANITVTSPTPNSLQQALQTSEELLSNAELVTQGFAKAGAEVPAAMVNLAAKQRMLSQRAAGAFLMYQTSAKSPEIKARALKAVADFKTAMSAFEDAKTEFPEVADRIEMARMQMVFFEHALSSIDAPTKGQFVTIATTSERILTEMEQMTVEIVKHLLAQQARVVSKK
jgi:hypothetical protein